MSLRLPLGKILSPPMRLDALCGTSSKLGRNPLSRQVFRVRNSRNPSSERDSNAAAGLSTLTITNSSADASRFSSVGAPDAAADGLHLAPKPQRMPPPVENPVAGDRFLSRPPPRRESSPRPRGLALRDRLQIARRRRPQEFRDSATAPSSFDLIVANRLASAAPPAPKEKEPDSLSPLVKAIFDLLDQAPPIEQPAPKSPPPSQLEPRIDDAASHQTFYHRQRHKYRIYQQAFNTGDPRFDSLGRTLCRILRHQATQLKLAIRSDGYVRVDDILRLSIRTHAGIPMNEHSVEEVLQVVERDPKQRYSTVIEDGQLLVRANQGHSMKVVESGHLLREITSADEVPVCVHGTFRCFLPSIMRTGLSRMSRNHVHFAIGLPTDEGVISGMMDTVEVLIYLDVARALRDDMKLYISDNKVLLTEGFAGIVPVEYFEKVVEWPSFAVIA